MEQGDTENEWRPKGIEKREKQSVRLKAYKAFGV